MPNSVTGSTDISNALSTNSVANSKSLLIIAAKNLDTGETSSIVKNTIYELSGVSDAKAKFGSLSKVPEFVRIAIANGVTNIKGMMIGTVPGDYASNVLAYTAAFSESLRDDTVKCIALDTNDATVLAALSTHLDTAELEDMFRYSGTAPDVIADDATIVTFANTLNNKRIFVPSSLFVDTNQQVLGGVYAGLGICCAIMTQTSDPALPLNGVEILGFGGVNRVLLSSQKIALVNGGVIPMYTSPSGNPTIYRLVTSCTKIDSVTDLTWQEGTTVFIADDVLESVEVDLRNRFKRTKNVVRILKAIKDAVVNVLDAKNGLEIIENFDKTTVSAVKDPDDIYGALVDYTFDVVTPLYTITIRQHMKL